MVGHKAEGQELNGKSGLCLSKQVDEGGIVIVFMEDDGSAVASVNQMEDRAGDISTRDTGHKIGQYYKGSGIRKEKSSLSPFLLRSWAVKRRAR